MTYLESDIWAGQDLAAGSRQRILSNIEMIIRVNDGLMRSRDDIVRNKETLIRNNDALHRRLEWLFLMTDY